MWIPAGLRKPLVYVVLGGGLGDEGKGKTAATLAALLRANKIERMGSGPNAGHKDEGHIHQQIPCGTAVPGAALVIPSGMMLDPLRLLKEVKEAHDLGKTDVFPRLWISGETRLVTLYHILLNRVWEVSHGREDGSTGRGNYEAVLDTAADLPPLLAQDLLQPKVLRDKIAAWLPRKSARLEDILGPYGRNEREISPLLDPRAFDLDFLVRAYAAAGSALASRIVTEAHPQAKQLLHLRRGDVAVIEGAQSIGLDQNLGTFPNITPYTTTVAALCPNTGIEIDEVTEGIICVRVHATRHGPGFFPTEIMDLPASQTAVLKDEGADIIDGDWPLPFRVGWLDLPLLRMAIYENQRLGVENISLSVTNLDRLDGFKAVPVCTYYTYTDERDLDALRGAGVEVNRLGDGTLALPRFHRALSEFPHFRKNVRPHYEWFEGWKTGKTGYQEIAAAASLDALPRQMQVYLRSLQEQVGAPIKMLSVGVSRPYQFLL